MVLETSEVDRYGKTTLLDSRRPAQIQVVAPGDSSNGRTPGEAGNFLDLPLVFVYKRKGKSSTIADGTGGRTHRTILRLEGSPD